MSRDYKNSGKPQRNGNPLGTGILIGLLLGLCLALGVALYINRAPSPFVDKQRSTPAAEKSSGRDSVTAPQKAAEQKPRFDFYKILPGTEEAVTGEIRRAPPPAAREVYYLQVAAFQNPAEADNLKARLALAGIESRVQTAELPDGKIWHRVRVGPFTDMKELNASRAVLIDNNYEANLIKVRDPAS